MVITRQHSQTEVHELYGKTCSELLAVVQQEKSNIADYLYLRTHKTWHRFALSAGLLFWDENAAPDEEDDIEEEEAYRDLGTELKLAGKVLKKIEMKNGRLDFRVEDGTGFQLTDLGYGTRIELNNI